MENFSFIEIQQEAHILRRFRKSMNDAGIDTYTFEVYKNQALGKRIIGAIWNDEDIKGGCN